jgi:hypothetical protein
MMVAVVPAEPERILSALLQARRAIAPLVVAPLRLEEELARHHLAEVALRLANGHRGRLKPTLRIGQGPRAKAKGFEMPRVTMVREALRSTTKSSASSLPTSARRTSPPG